MSQPNQNNAYTRKWNDLQINPRYNGMSQERLKFEACKLAVHSMVNALESILPWKIQQEDLEDYSYALLDIYRCYREFSNSPVGTKYHFSNLIDPLNQAIQYLGVALGQKNNNAKKRTESIQTLIKKLDMILEQIKGQSDPPL